jgi:hypothetical protein
MNEFTRITQDTWFEGNCYRYGDGEVNHRKLINEE